MAKTRAKKKIDIDQFDYDDTNFESSLPIELYCTFTSHAPDSVKMRAKFSRTCKLHYSFFRPEMDKHAAEQLLKYVTSGNAIEAKKMYAANPRLLFIEAIAEEYASGFIHRDQVPIHRIVQMSPIRAMAGAGDVWMLNEVLSIITQIQDVKARQYYAKKAVMQIKQQFPLDYDNPPNSFNFALLNDAITNDQRLILRGKPNDETKKQLYRLRKYFMPGIVKSGHFFILNALGAACRLYWLNRYLWNNRQLQFLELFVIGYLERLVTAIDAQIISQGITKALRRDGVIERLFLMGRVLVASNERKEDNNYFPLDEYDDFRLGIDYFIDGFACTSVRLDSSYWFSMDADLFNDLAQLKVDKMELIMQQLFQLAGMQPPIYEPSIPIDAPPTLMIEQSHEPHVITPGRRSSGRT